MIDNRKKNFLLSTVLMNCLVQQSLPETTGEEYSPYRENFHSVEDFMWLDFENVQNLFLIMIEMKKKTATNNSNFPLLSFFFSFSAWFQVYLGWGEGGCWSNVIFNAFTFKKPSQVCIYSHCTLPTLETLRVFKIGTITELCSLSGVQERSMVSLHNLQHSGFATIDYNNYM